METKERFDNKITEVENAVEEYFCKEMDKAPKDYFDKDITNLLLELLMKKSLPLSDVAKKDKFFLYELIEKRVQFCFTFKIEDARVIILLCQVAKNAGTAVMYLTYIQYLLKKRNERVLNLDNLCRFFPSGFINEDVLHEIWDKQKIKTKNGGSDNLLDYQSAMKSIQYHDNDNNDKNNNN